MLAANEACLAAGGSLLGRPWFELRRQGTQVVAVHVGYIDTDLASRIAAPKLPPDEVVRAVLAGLEAGRDEVLVDELSRQVKQGLAADPAVYAVPR